MNYIFYEWTRQKMDSGGDYTGQCFSTLVFYMQIKPCKTDYLFTKYSAHLFGAYAMLLLWSIYNFFITVIILNLCVIIKYF